MIDRNKDTINIQWDIHDVWNLDADLTTKQCRDVLSLIEREHDATVGVNWDVIALAIDEIKRY